MTTDNHSMTIIRMWKATAVRSGICRNTFDLIEYLNKPYSEARKPLAVDIPDLISVPTRGRQNAHRRDTCIL